MSSMARWSSGLVFCTCFHPAEARGVVELPLFSPVLVVVPLFVLLLSKGVILEVSHPASAKVVKPELQEKVIAMLRQLLLSPSLPAGTLEAVKEAVSTRPFALTFINTKF